MSWFSSANLTELAKSALKEAQKTIDKALDIPDESPEKVDATAESIRDVKSDDEVEGDSKSDQSLDASKVASSLWGSFSGSFFDAKSKDVPKSEQGNESWKWNWASATSGSRSATPEPRKSSSEGEREEQGNEDISEQTSKNDETIADLDATIEASFDGSVLAVVEHQECDEDHRSNASDVATPVPSITVFEPLHVVIPDDSVRIVDFPVELAESQSEEADSSGNQGALESGEAIAVQDDSSMHSSSGDSNLTLLGMNTSAFDETSFAEFSQSGSFPGASQSESQHHVVEDHFAAVIDDCRKGDGSSSSSVDSFVRCDHLFNLAKNKDTCSISDRSEKLAQSIGQLSTDDGDMCTSSDIEIISSPNGDHSNGSEAGSSKFLSSAQHSHAEPAFSVYSPSGRRGSRSSSISLISDCHSPPVASGLVTSSACTAPLKPHPIPQSFTKAGSHEGHQRQSSDASSSICSVPDSSSGNGVEVENLLKRIVDLNALLELKDAKLVEYSLANAALMEANSNLQSAVAAEKEGASHREQEKSTCTVDLKKQIASLEGKLEAMTKSREKAEANYEKLKKDLEGKKSLKQLAEELREKDEIIFDLRREGEDLSKQRLKLELVIKNLRAKDKDSTASVIKLRSEVEDSKKKRESLEEKLKSTSKQVEDLKASLDENLDVRREHEHLLVKLNSELEDLRFNYDSTRTALEGAYKTMEQSRQELQEKKAELLCTQEARSDETKRLKDFEEERNFYETQVTNLKDQVELLRISLDSERGALELREIELKSELKELQERLRKEESRCEALSAEMGTVTEPLLAQIEALQASMSSQRCMYEAAEAALSAQNSELEQRLAALQVASASEAEEAEQLRSEVKTKNDLISQLRKDIAEKFTIAEEFRSKMESAIEDLKSERTQNLKMCGEMRKELVALEKEKTNLEHELDIERSTLQAEKRKAAGLQENLSALQQMHSTPRMEALHHHMSWSSDRSRDDSADESCDIPAADGSPNETLGRSSPTPSLARLSFADSSFVPGQWNTSDDAFDSASRVGFDPAQASVTSVVEILQSQLSRREGEVLQLQREVERWKQQRSCLSDEITRLSSENEEFKTELSSLGTLRGAFADLQREHNAILQMYGEKVEEADELRMDITDMKEMFKNQIEELLRKSS